MNGLSARRYVAVGLFFVACLPFWPGAQADDGTKRFWCREVLNSIGTEDYFIALARELAEKAPSREASTQCEPALAEAQAEQDLERRRQLIGDYLRCMARTGGTEGGLVLTSKETFFEEIEQRQRKRAVFVKEFSELRCDEFGFVLPAAK
jgi:hypothetical protein